MRDVLEVKGCSQDILKLILPPIECNTFILNELGT